MRRRKNSKKFVVLGVDQSLRSSGICYPSGVADVCTMPTGKNELRGIPRLVHILGWLSEHLETCKPTHVCWESYSYGSKGRALFEIGELGGVLKLLVLSRGIPIIAVPPQTLKKYVTGKGNAKKHEMQEAILDRWGYWYEDDNEADAHALMRYGQMWLDASMSEEVDEEVDALMSRVTYLGVTKKLQSFAINL